MSQPFTFPPPPPPPPPPKPSSNQGSYPLQNSRGGHRGRDSSSTYQQDNRGGGSRGQYPSRGSHRGSYANRGNGVNYRGQEHQFYKQNHQSTSRSQHVPKLPQNGLLNAPQKRPYSTAFANQPNNHVAKSRPSAPPPVPSFGIDFDALLPKKPEAPKNAVTPAVRKTNQLGLTPAKQTSDSESEDDNEEESKLANILAGKNVLQFEYRGETSSLNTPEEIAAWVAERRKRWPTEAKREVARKEAEERKKRAEAENAARIEASKIAAKAKQEEREKQRIEREKSQVRQKMLHDHIQKAGLRAKQLAAGSAQNPAQIKAARLGKKAQKVSHQLKVAEMALAKQTQGKHTNDESELQGDSEKDIDTLMAQLDQIAAAQQGQKQVDADTTSEPDSDADAADDTSTSGSSSPSDTESESDSGPEQLSSKNPQPPAKPPTNGPAPADRRPLCVNYTRTGRCKFGKRCRFRHDKAALAQESGAGTGGRRKGLYQVLVEKELEMERRRALRVIIALGDAGILDEPDAALPAGGGGGGR